METDIASNTPQQTWENLKAGNARYASGQLEHPHASADRRADLRAGQDPKVAIFSCGDSRVPAELVFDMGLGDAFIIRNAGHIVDEAVLASVQFAVDDLNCNLLVVMGHQSCGAVKATVGFLEKDATIPVGFQRAIVEKVSLAALAAKAEGKDTTDDFERRNTVETVKQLMARIPHLQARVEDGTLGIVGIRYLLDDGTIEPLILHGVQ
ncbi:carbonic anhydrase [uncultured Corynebacterium sp.]|uniref:carbonic anhydrase n=1 Tax=uncultured Corynebacterium sp. TaxID=159447 RepID=UPI0025E7D102|nr:carbonic anhydrase [uncultured Corynebacterium sp.]